MSREIWLSGGSDYVLWYVWSNSSEEMVASFFRALEQGGRGFLLKLQGARLRRNNHEPDKAVGKLSLEGTLESASGCVRIG